MEEKRRLYKKLGKAGLQSEESAYMNLINSQKDTVSNLQSPMPNQQRVPSKTRKESTYKQHYHNANDTTNRIITALSTETHSGKSVGDLENGLKSELRSLDDQIGDVFLCRFRCLVIIEIKFLSRVAEEQVRTSGSSTFSKDFIRCNRFKSHQCTVVMEN